MAKDINNFVEALGYERMKMRAGHTVHEDLGRS